MAAVEAPLTPSANRQSPHGRRPERRQYLTPSDPAHSFHFHFRIDSNINYLFNVNLSKSLRRPDAENPSRASQPAASAIARSADPHREINATTELVIGFSALPPSASNQERKRGSCWVGNTRQGRVGRGGGGGGREILISARIGIDSFHL